MSGYRITITGATVTSRDHLSLQCVVEKGDDAGGWEVMAGTPTALQVTTAAVLAILRRDISDADKRAELLALLRSHALALPILQGDAALDQIEALLPAGWPVTVDL
jgi:hypothetical protein